MKSRGKFPLVLNAFLLNTDDHVPLRRSVKVPRSVILIFLAASQVAIFNSFSAVSHFLCHSLNNLLKIENSLFIFSFFFVYLNDFKASSKVLCYLTFRASF